MTDLEFTVPDLLQGKEYLFKVCACNKCGPGEPAYVDEPVNMSAPASEYILIISYLASCYLFLFFSYLFFGHTCVAYGGASLVAERLKHRQAMQETWVLSLVWEEPLEKEMATHSSILAWKIPWTEEPGGLYSMR